jgi:hypothetical protein
MKHKPSGEDNSHSASQEVPVFYGTRRFIIVLTRSRYWGLYSARNIQFASPRPNSQRSILLLSTHLRLGLPIRLFPSGFPTKMFYTFIVSPMRATCHASLNLHCLIALTIFDEAYNLRSSSLCSLLQPPVTFSHLDRNVLLSTLFSKNSHSMLFR